MYSTLESKLSNFSATSSYDLLQNWLTRLITYITNLHTSLHRGLGNLSKGTRPVVIVRYDDVRHLPPGSGVLWTFFLKYLGAILSRPNDFLYIRCRTMCMRPRMNEYIVVESFKNFKKKYFFDDGCLANKYFLFNKILRCKLLRYNILLSIYLLSV